MVNLGSSTGICLLMLMMMLLMTPVKSARQPQYGLDSIEGFCEGWGELDQLSDITSQLLNIKYPYMGSMRAQVWVQDHFGFPINARPYSAIGTMEKIDIAEVLNQMVKKACNFEKPKTKPPTITTTTTATTTTTTVYRKGKAEATTTAKEVVATEKEVDRVLVEPVVAEPAYPNLVSIISKNEFTAILAKMLGNLLAEFESNIKIKLYI